MIQLPRACELLDSFCWSQFPEQNRLVTNEQKQQAKRIHELEGVEVLKEKEYFS